MSIEKSTEKKIDRDRMHKNRPIPEKTRTDDLFARLGEAFEADAATVERIKVRARARARDERTPRFSHRASHWAFRMAVVSALTLLVAVGVWRLPRNDNPSPALPTMLEEPTEAEPEPTLVISNESGFVTVQAGGSQWIVLPGDVS